MPFCKMSLNNSAKNALPHQIGNLCVCLCVCMCVCVRAFFCFFVGSWGGGEDGEASLFLRQNCGKVERSSNPAT